METPPSINSCILQVIWNTCFSVFWCLKWETSWDTLLSQLLLKVEIMSLSKWVFQSESRKTICLCFYFTNIWSRKLNLRNIWPLSKLAISPKGRDNNLTPSLSWRKGKSCVAHVHTIWKQRWATSFLESLKSYKQASFQALQDASSGWPVDRWKQQWEDKKKCKKFPKSSWPVIVARLSWLN